MKYAVQFYSLRDLTKTPEGLRHCLESVAKMGYAGIQVSMIETLEKEISPEQLKEWLDELGLECCATHRGWDKLRDETDAEIAFHKALGCRYVALGMAPKYCFEDGTDGWRRWIAELPPVLDRLNGAGIDFGYHNHHVEWAKKDGITGFDILVNEADSRLQFELDTYWAVHAGLNCERLIQSLPGRLKVVHLKDKEVINWETRFAPLGQGNIDWTNILPALDAAGCEWGVVEQDEHFGFDALENLAISHRYLSAR